LADDEILEVECLLDGLEEHGIYADLDSVVVARSGEEWRLTDTLSLLGAAPEEDLIRASFEVMNSRSIGTEADRADIEMRLSTFGVSGIGR